MPRYATVPTPLGPFTLVLKGGALVRAGWDPEPPPGATEDPDALAPYAQALKAYFGGEPLGMPGPVRPAGTPFQRRVWEALLQIPHGATTSYGALARTVGEPEGAQAVGAANGANPVALFVPCHRVVGADGSLTGYAGGLGRKRALLALERGQTSLF